MRIHFPDLNPGKRKEFLILICCLLIGFALRFYTFDQKSLWIDEIHTFNDSKDNINGQLKYYKANPTYLHPPLFFVLTHLFHPFTKPERDLRIIPLIFGTLSIPIIYLLSGLFSPNIALPCTLSLTFMAYHISLSQDGRSYSLAMFLGIVGLYFFMKYLQTLKKRYLFLVVPFFVLLFYTSYSSISFIILSQILWFYRINDEDKKPLFSSFLILNSLILLMCIPWIIFVASNYKGQPLMNPLFPDYTGSFWSIMGCVFHDWVPHLPLMVVSIILFILLPFFLKYRRNALILLTLLFLPVIGLSLSYNLLNLNHFFSSRYFVNFLPIFFISIYLSLDATEIRFERFKRLVRLRFLFVSLFILSNLIILPLYYRSEKEDFRGLATYLKSQLREGDKIFINAIVYLPGILHYFGVHPEGRHFIASFGSESVGIAELRKSFIYRNQVFTIYHSNTCCAQYIADGRRLWIIVGTKRDAKELKNNSPCILKGYFDGSFLNFKKFPTDASIYLFLWDPKSPDEKGIEMPIE
jgi:hypothetical protein